MVLGYDFFSSTEILRALLPAAVDVPSAFETVGHVAHLNLREPQLPFKKSIAQVVLDKNAHIKTVVNKVAITTDPPSAPGERPPPPLAPRARSVGRPSLALTAALSAPRTVTARARDTARDDARAPPPPRAALSCAPRSRSLWGWSVTRCPVGGRGRGAQRRGRSRPSSARSRWRCSRARTTWR